ncbi:MAG TPA: hypothetical protein HA367_09320 [Candidatus Methanofastidiosum sp.]|nr:hypothetical protein [Methanofastidiosum sp.]
MNDISVMGFPFNTVLILKSSAYWYESPLLSGLLGVIVGFALTGMRDYFKGRKELNQYEYFLLSKTQDILENSKAQKENIDKFVDEFYSDLRSAKLGSSKMVFDSLLKARKGIDYSDEKGKIDARLKSLRKKGPICRLKSLLK